MEEINTTEVTSTSTSTLDGEYILIPVKAKKEWLQNAFKKKEQTTTQPHLLPGNVLVQDRHRWIQEELQLRKTLKSQGKSDLAITHELVQARKRWLDDERKKYHETVIMSPGENGKIERFLHQEEKKENDAKPDPHGATVASPVVSRDVVEARKKWLDEEAFGNHWQRPIGVEGNPSMLSTLSMETKVGLAAVIEDQVNGLDPISPREALRLTFEETNTLKTAQTSECDEDPAVFEEMLVESNSAISNKKVNDNTTVGDSHQGENNLDNHYDKAQHYRQQDLMMAPTDERLGLSTKHPRLNAEPALDGETPPAVDRDNWKIVQSNSDPVDTPCLEQVCSIL
jgi:hypothetical protein